jgi:hypothetical protein
VGTFFRARVPSRKDRFNTWNSSSTCASLVVREGAKPERSAHHFWRWLTHSAKPGGPEVLSRKSRLTTFRGAYLGYARERFRGNKAVSRKSRSGISKSPPTRPSLGDWERQAGKTGSALWGATSPSRARKDSFVGSTWPAGATGGPLQERPWEVKVLSRKSRLDTLGY